MVSFKLSEIKNALRILALDKRAIQLIENKDSANRLSWLILAMPAFLYIVFLSFFSTSGFSLIAMKFNFWPLIIPQLSLMISALLVGYFANNYLHGHGDLKGLFRVLAHFFVIYWAGIVILFFDYIGVWSAGVVFNLFFLLILVGSLFVFNYLLCTIFKIHKREALLCLGFTVLIYFILNELLGSILIGSYYKIFM